MAIVAAVAVPVGASLTLLSQGPDQRELRTGVALALESVMEQVCAMSFEDIPYGPDAQTPADIEIEAIVDGETVLANVYVTPHGFLENVRWEQVPFSIESAATSLTPPEPWKLVPDAKAGVIEDPNVKVICVELMGEEMETLLIKNPSEWQSQGPGEARGVEVDVDPKEPPRKWRYRGSMKPKWKHSRGKCKGHKHGKHYWPGWIFGRRCK